MTPRQETAAKLRRTADAIEAEPDHFDMANWFSDEQDNYTYAVDIPTQHECGTAGCIAGYMAILAQRDGLTPSGDEGVDEFAARWIGLDWRRLEHLFLWWPSPTRRVCDLVEVTPAMAVAELRRMAAEIEASA